MIVLYYVIQFWNKIRKPLIYFKAKYLNKSAIKLIDDKSSHLFEEEDDEVEY